MTRAFSHVTADFRGVAQPSLRDASLVSGLLIAAAGAAGFAPLGAPVVRQLPSGGVAAVLVLDGCHIAVHTFPERDLLLLDVLAPATHTLRTAVEVFVRRLAPHDVRTETRERG
ncbi:MAG TPA: S-adenosylmethionine decarboxylase [Gemmatimonadaceae bacterium]|nr:S-adenosylmethionine decarboxylase [Gemmatimonadaceae bacterium]